MTNSTDRGASWGAVVDVQKTLRNKPAFNSSGCMAPTNGHATQLAQSGPHPGRLLFSGQTDSYNGSIGLFSDNHGISWDWTDSLHVPGMDECAMAQLPNGSVMAIMRNCPTNLHGHCQGRRRLLSDERQQGAPGSKRFAYAISTDGGTTFDQIRLHPDLVTPVCQGSLLGYKDMVLFAGPFSEVSRTNLSVLASYDNGRTFSKSLILDPGPAGYTGLQCGLPEPLDCAILYDDERGSGNKFNPNDHGLLVFRRFASAALKSDDPLHDARSAPDPTHAHAQRTQPSIRE